MSSVDKHRTGRILLGVDIGGTGIKGARVDTRLGEVVGEHYRVLTSKPATPDAVVDRVAQVVDHLPDRRTDRRHVSGDRPTRRRR